MSNFETLVKAYAAEMLLDVRQMVQDNWHPSLTHVDVAKPEGGELIRSKAFEYLQSEFGLTASIVPGDYRSREEVQLSGDFLRFIDPTSYVDAGARLAKSLIDDIKDAIINAPVIEQFVDIANPDNRSTKTVASLAKMAVETRYGVRFEDLPSGHGASKLRIRVHLNGKLDAFLSL